VNDKTKESGTKRARKAAKKQAGPAGAPEEEMKVDE
jgi:hypothetical protein